MYGLVFEIVEEWVIEKQGIEVWHAIKKQAGCKVDDQAFLRRSYYPDEELVVIIVAASELLNISIPDILEAFGHYVIRHHYRNGYDDLLQCQGSNLRQWLSNLNAMHDHVQKSFPGEQFSAPIFWCEDCDTVEGSILLHYYSLRGTLLVPMVVGIVEELASFQFQVEVKMHQLVLQDDDNKSPFTSWRITAVDPNEAWKLSPTMLDNGARVEEGPVDFSKVKIPGKCPFTGRKLKKTPQDGESDDGDSNPASLEEDDSSSGASLSQCPHHQKLQQQQSQHAQVGLTLQKMQEVFPFHILVGHDFSIQQVGYSLPALLSQASSENFYGKHIQDFLDITRPVLGSSWDWKALQKLSDQHFFLAPKVATTSTLHKKVSMAESNIRFKAAMITISSDQVMFVLNPDARNVVELNSMGLTMSDLPLVSCQRDTVFLGEYIAQEVDKAHKLDKLSKKLSSEKNLSNTLLYNMLPKQVADELRAGNTVEPKMYEDVTLFFSDIEGFTSICDQVHPWEVIDMLNQLYGIMDHLAMKFNLYKIETIGDAYMCCSGLPEPDEYHAENIANFALAVMECVKHIKSPVDHVTPLQMRIGIHTGSCTAGVVGTLTPHFCLFGDMVNTTSRHESTGLAGRVHVSSTLFGRLKHFSKFGEDKPQYNFTPRGLVDMKGKGNSYTYWLDSGTDHNPLAGPDQINELSREIASLLSTKKFTRRRYFRRNGDMRDGTMSDGGTISTYKSRSSNGSSIEGDTAACKRDEQELFGAPRLTAQDTHRIVQMRKKESGVSFNVDNSDRNEEDMDQDSTQGEVHEGGPGSDGTPVKSNDEDGAFGISDQEKKDLDELLDEHERLNGTPDTWDDSTGSSLESKEAVESWFALGKDVNLSTEELATKMHALLSPMLKLCLRDSAVPDMELITCQLYGFVHRISTLYSRLNEFHNFSRAAHVVQTVNHLWGSAKRAHDSCAMGVADWNPWNGFIMVFASLVHGVKHNGSTNAQLEKENHPIYQLHGNGRQSCLQRQAIHSALGVLADEFPELYDEIVFACPKFLALTRKVILAMDLESKESCNKRTATFKKALASQGSTEREIRQRTEAIMEQVATLSAIGHYSQDFSVFKRWHEAEFEEVLAARHAKSREMWHRDTAHFFSHVVLPLLDRVEAIIPESYCKLRECVDRNMMLWEEEKPLFQVSTISIPAQSIGTQSLSVSTTPVDQVLGHTVLYNKKLVKVMAKILLSLLKRVVVSHDGVSALLDHQVHLPEQNPVEEVQMVIPMKHSTKNIDKEVAAMEFSPAIREEVHDFVATIATGYRKNEFHNFEHATNVAALASLLLKRIQKSDQGGDVIDPSFGIGSDPLVHFSVVFAALVHDVGHTGVPNQQLAKEQPEVAERYTNKSIAEQRSVDTAWNLLMQDRFSNFRRCIYDNPGERQRFRQLLIHSIINTDIFDKDLQALGKARWETSFGNGPSDSISKSHFQATSTIEQIIQASDIAHTMQQWAVYTKWNERLFLEMYSAFVSGRSDKNPADGWYKGELWFFDNKVIPLATKLQECGVFGSTGDEYLEFAKSNRQEWEARGETVCAKLLEKARQKFQTPSSTSVSTKEPILSKGLSNTARTTHSNAGFVKGLHLAGNLGPQNDRDDMNGIMQKAIAIADEAKFD